MQTSSKGIAFLERHEGVVLRAYRDPVGVWTIGPGLTKASGVVVPKAGMVITIEESRALTARALERNYEPAVLVAMAGAKQHEFDGGVSFHWNTGAIFRATWVKRWIAKDWAGVKSGLLAWNKGGGKVLPGLTRRRQEEYDLIGTGFYGIGETKGSTSPRFAAFSLSMTLDEREAVRTALAGLGYATGAVKGAVARDAALKFQKDHALTQDGIIGRATLSTLQRMIDARAKAKGAATVTATGGGGMVATATDAAGDLTDALAALPWIGPALIGAGLLWAAWLAFHYRDAVAAKAQTRAPRLAAKLRSF